MKTTTRILIALLLVVSLLCALCVFVSAEGEDETTPEPETAVSEENGASEAVEKQGFASAVWEFVSDNADKIFAVANAALASILLWQYRRSLIPSVGKSLTMINGAVSETSRTLAEQNNATATSIKLIVDILQPFLSRTEELTTALSTIKSEKEAQLIIDKGVFDLLGLIIETGRVPDSVKEQYRLYKAKADGAMMEIEGSGDSE